MGAGTSLFFGRSKDFVLGAFETGEMDMLCGVPTEDHILCLLEQVLGEDKVAIAAVGQQGPTSRRGM